MMSFYSASLAGNALGLLLNVLFRIPDPAGLLRGGQSESTPLGFRLWRPKAACLYLPTGPQHRPPPCHIRFRSADEWE